MTNLFTSLNSAEADLQIGSLVDTWLVVKAVEGYGERNRVLSVLKSRGTAHSNQIGELLLSDEGVDVVNVYVGPKGVLTGSARRAQEAKEHSDGTARLQDLEQRRNDLERRRESVKEQTANLWRALEDEADVVGRLLSRASAGLEEDGSGRRVERSPLGQTNTDDFEDLTCLPDMHGGSE